MEAQFKFDLPDEQPEFELCVNARDYYCALSDIDNECRNLMKHGDISNETYKILEKLRCMVPELN